MYTCDFLPCLLFLRYGIVLSTSISEIRIVMLDNHSCSMVDPSGLFMIWSLLKALSARELLFVANDTSILNYIVGWLNIDSWVNSLKVFKNPLRMKSVACFFSSSLLLRLLSLHLHFHYQNAANCLRVFLISLRLSYLAFAANWKHLYFLPSIRKIF